MDAGIDALEGLGRPRPIYKHLYFKVLVAIVLGVALGAAAPEYGAAMKPLGDAFIKLIKMIIAPIIFVTVVHGIAAMRDAGKVGRIGIKALIYFEVVTTFALLIGFTVAHLVQPGVGMNIDPTTIDTKDISAYVEQSKVQSTTQFLLDIIPKTLLGALSDGNILQVLLVAVLFAFALQSLGEKGQGLVSLIDQIAHVLFKIVGFVMRFAPIGAFGAMAFTIGKYGLGSLASLAWLMVSFYATCLLFIFGVLGGIAYYWGFSIFRLLAYLKEELLIVLGTSSSESVLPRMIAKMENAGVEESVAGLVIPTGYSFNLDGTCIYLTMATLFLAQATNTELSATQQLGLIGILLITSKGAAGVTGSGFVILAATLASTGTIPVAAMALILGIDRFMSEARALTNLIGNGVATIVIAKSEKSLDVMRFDKALSGD